ncbi:hypothetical protein MSAN_02456200 [Mycena sanguinolenta]|uniref:Uncharacterized protein n=1 Tax=Mycena sanguinolenta TaxID=230812 RepID=A0A8H6WXR7_9AGAR|nr:hypothetical protein MSAN_02456200 [Mycena sanguinolenta]
MAASANRLYPPAKASLASIHIHCFTDSPAFAQRLLDWFPILYIGITGASSCHPTLPFLVSFCASPPLCSPARDSQLVATSPSVDTCRDDQRLGTMPEAAAARPSLTPALRPRAPSSFPPSLILLLLCVITYTPSTDTSIAVRNMFASPPSSSAPSSAPPAPASSTPNASATASEEEDARLRMRLETDAPSMVPAPIYTSPLFTALVAKAKEQQGGKGGGGVKLSLCHSGAEFVAGLLSPARRMKQRRS